VEAVSMEEEEGNGLFNRPEPKKALPYTDKAFFLVNCSDEIIFY
jgi:hypothetical protein